MSTEDPCGFRDLPCADDTGAQTAWRAQRSRSAALEFRVDCAHDGQRRCVSSSGQPASSSRTALPFVDRAHAPRRDGLETIQCCGRQTRGCRWSSALRTPVITGADHGTARPVPQAAAAQETVRPIEVLQFAHALTRKSAPTRRRCANNSTHSKKSLRPALRGLEAANRQLRHMATHDALTHCQTDCHSTTG